MKKTYKQLSTEERKTIQLGVWGHKSIFIVIYKLYTAKDLTFGFCSVYNKDKVGGA